MVPARLRWIVALLLCLPSATVFADEPLVPDGEGIDLLEGAQWAPFTGPRTLASSGDGKIFATSSDDGVVRLWDASTAREIHRFPREASVSALALSNDGKVLATGSRDGSVQLWDTTTNKSTAHHSGDGIAIANLVVNPNGKAVVFSTRRGAPNYWPVEGDAAVTPWSDIADTRALAWSPDGVFVAVGHGDHLITLVDAAQHKTVRSMSTPDGAVTALAVSSDGKKLAAGTDNGLLYLWDFAGGRTQSVEAHSRPVNTALFAGNLLLTSATDGSVRVWNPTNLQIIRKLKTQEPCCTGVFLATQTALSMTTRGLTRWDIASGRELTPIRAQTNAITALSIAGPSARAIALASGDGIIRAVEGATGRVLARLASTADSAVAVSADEKKFAYSDAEHSIHIVAANQWTDLQQLPPMEAAPTALAFSPDGRALVAALGSFGLRAWDTESGRKLFETKALSSVSALVFSADGAMIAAGEGAALVLHNAATGVEIKRFSLAGVISSVAISGDGKRVAAGLVDGSVRLADVAGSAENGRLPASNPGPVFVALSRDGKSAATAGSDGDVHFWTLQGNKELAHSDAHAGIATGIALSSDDAIATVATADGAVTTWNFGPHTLVGVLRFGPAGWASVIGARILRSDSGGFVLKANEKGELVPVPPRPGNTTPDLSADITTTPIGQGTAVGQITIAVKNNSKTARAYWVTIEKTPLPPGLSLMEYPVIDRLDPGASASLNIPVSYVSPGSPLPMTLKVELRMVHASGRGPIVPASLQIHAPHVQTRFLSLEGSTDAPVLRLSLNNTGDEATGPLTITSEFVDKDQVVGRAPSQEIPSLDANRGMLLAVAGPPGIVRPGVTLRITASGPVWPTYAWVEPVMLHRSYPWLSIIAIVVSVLGSIVVLYLLFVTRNPIVVQVSKDPARLRQYELSALQNVEKYLKRAMRLKDALAGAGVPENRWTRAVKAGTSPENAALAFAEVIGAKKGEQQIGEFTAWTAELPPFDLRFPHRTAIAVVTGAELEAGAAAMLATTLHADGEGPTVALAIDMTSEQNARPVLQAAPNMSFVVLTSNELRDLIYADDPKTMFQQLIVTQRPLSELSPYQSAGGVEDEGLFFGREKELRTIADRTLHNFILVAPRQMGKSSLLKAVQRRLSSRPDVEVHLIELSDDDVALRIARALNRPRTETADGFIELAAGTRRKPRVWLIDECDRFIVRDARLGYPISQAMRTLSEEGRAFFVMAGFWHLYAAVALNANNPLRNFGEMLRLEPLDRTAARDLATKPMEAMGIRYEDPALVEVILDETACRAHLITVVCRALVASLGAENPVITAEAVNAALVQNPTLWDEFKYWRREPLGRALVRLTLLEGPGTRGELRERLKEHGLEVTNETYHATMDRLDLGYVLVPNAESRLECPVPVLRRFIELEDDLEAGLRGDIEEILGTMEPPAAEAPQEQPAEEAPAEEQPAEAEAQSEELPPADAEATMQPGEVLAEEEQPLEGEPVDDASEPAA